VTTPNLLTVEEAAEALRCSVRTLQRRISSGELRAYRDGRIVRVPTDELRRYVREHLGSSLSPERAEGRGRPLPPGSRLWAA
jgi:excisionase family DNA binding protein